MARYGGGHEDLNEERRKLAALEGQLDSLTAKEQVARREAGATEGALERQLGRRERLTQIQREQRAVKERAAAVENVEARAINQSTAALERNARARERAAVATVNHQRALRGAGDPLLARAHALGAEGLPPSQYQLRQQLGIGSARAQRLQEAIGAGYAPARSQEHDRPLTAQRAVVQADIDRAAAQRAYTNAIRRGDAAAAEAAAASRQEAVARKEAANAELKSAGSARAAAAATDRRVAQTAGVPPSGALVPRTAAAGARGGRMFGESGPFYGAFPPPGRNFMQEAPPRAAGREQAARATARQAAASHQLNQELSAEERAANRNMYEFAAQQRAQAAGATDRLARATHFSAVELGTASQAMRRHGTLTSEFITAALRGETTLREIGQQAVVTAGKFGAWTLAASAIYGAVGAVHQLGQGAIDSSSGVNQLQRVIANVHGDDLQQSFSDLAGQFNVPVNVATDAVYRMGQVFHNQADAVEASKAALYSFKTGEVDVATSTQNLIAIVNGFGLSSDQLVDVYDQINQAQNTFGVRIGDTEAGLAKAAGTFRNAGGDLNYLLALFVAIQKATGRSGQEVGTGIARGVNQIRQPSNQAKLRQQGVDVDPDNFQKTLQSAFVAARRPGADLQQIATGLLGNQYARLVAPVLRNQTLLNRALKDTSPEASKNSAQRELARVLGSVDEQISKIGVSLQRMGAGLARAGAGDAVYLLLRGLNLVLTTAVSLIETFDRLPAPLRHALTLMAQMALAAKVLGRFGGLPGLAQRTGLPVGSADARVRTLAIRGARDAENAANDARERLTRNAYNAQARADIIGRQAAGANAAYARADAAGRLPPVESRERARLDRRNALLNQEAALAEEAAVKAQIEANTARELSLDASRRKTELERASAAQVAAQVEAERLAYPYSMNVPEPHGAVVPGGRGAGRGRVMPGGLAGNFDTALIGASAARGAGYVEDAGQATREAAKGMNRVERAVLPYTAGLRDLGDRARSSNVVTRPLGRAADATAAGVERAAGSIAGAGRGLRGIGSSLAGLARALGPLDVAILGLIGFEVLSHATDQLAQDQARAMAALERSPHTSGGVRRQGEAARRALDRQQPGPTYPVGYLPVPNRAMIGLGIRSITENFGGYKSLTDPNYENPIQRERRLRDQAKNLQGEQERIDKLQSEARRDHRPVPLQSLNEVRRRMDHDAKLRAQGIISLAEFDRRMAIHASEITTARNPTQRGVEAARAAMRRQLRESATGLHERYAGATPEEIRDRMSLLGAQVETGTAPRSVRREFGYAYRRLAVSMAGQTDPKALLQFFQDRQSFYKALEDGAKAELETALAGADTEAQRRAAYARAGQQLANLPAADRKALTNHRRALRRTRRDLRGERPVMRELRALGLTGDTAEGVLGFLGNVPGLEGIGIAGQSLQKLKAKFQRDKQQEGRLSKAVKDDKKRIHEVMTRRRKDQQELEQQALQDREEGRDIQLALRQSRTKDTLTQANEAIRSAQAGVRDARAHGNGRQVAQAVTKLNQAEQQRDQVLLERVQGLNSIAEARAAATHDPVTIARTAQQSAQRVLNTLRSQHADPGKIAEAYGTVLQAGVATADAAHEQASQLATLRFQTQAARHHGTPEAQARAAERTARYEIAHARNAVERAQGIKDLAEANNQAEQVAADAEQARFEVLLSLTDDPVEQARIRLRGAQHSLRRAHGRTARRQARAEVNNDRRALRDARLQSREDDIEFDLDMDRITRQQAISQYRAILRSHNLTKAQRREILRRIHALRQETDQEASGFGLQVGQGVKLPTIYDVRRAISGAKQAGNQGTQVNARTAVTVNVEVNDPDAAGKVFDAIDDALSTGVKSTMRSAGMSL